MHVLQGASGRGLDTTIAATREEFGLTSAPPGTEDDPEVPDHGRSSRVDHVAAAAADLGLQGGRTHAVVSFHDGS